MEHRCCSVLYFFLYCLSLVWRCVVTNCGTTYTTSSGKIRPPNVYRGNYICAPFKILLPVGKRIHLEWKKFNFAGKMPYCSYEFVRISRCTSPRKHIIRYCGPLVPNDFYSYDNCIMIDFRTADSWSKPEERLEEKFLLRYKTLDVSRPLYPVLPSPDCFNIRGHESDNTTTIYTPGWPLSYNKYLGNKFCKTTITLRKNWNMNIVFMGIDLYTPFLTNSKICEDVRNDVLTITTMVGLHYRKEHYCFKRKPFIRNYSGSYQRVDITFRAGTSDIHNHTGFVLGIAFFEKTSNGRTGLRSGDIAGIFIGVGVLVGCFFHINMRVNRAGGYRAYLRQVRRRLITRINLAKENRRARQNRRLTTQDEASRSRISNETGPYIIPRQPPNYSVTLRDMQDGEVMLHSNSVPTSVHQPSPAIPPPYADAPPSYDEANAVPPVDMSQFGAPHEPPERPPSYDLILYEHRNMTLRGER